MSRGRGVVRMAAASGLVALLTIAGAATAENLQAIALGPKQLEIVKLDDGTAEARVDEQVVAKNYFIEIETSFSDATGGAALLLVSDGSNGCAGQYQVVSVDAQGAVAHTDVFGDCSDTAEGSAANGSLSIRFPPVAGQDGALYSWTFAKGLEGPTPEPFQPKPGTSWADAPALAGAYPWEALDNADVYAAFRALLGSDFSTFTDDFGTADKMQTTADGIVYGTCFSNEGETSSDLFIAVDPAKHQVFAALKPGDADASFYPPEAEWPASLRARVKAWP
jgi:hypothetical protein